LDGKKDNDDQRRSAFYAIPNTGSQTYLPCIFFIISPTILAPASVVWGDEFQSFGPKTQIVLDLQWGGGGGKRGQAIYVNICQVQCVTNPILFLFLVANVMELVQAWTERY